MTTPTWEAMADDELLDRLGLALATEPTPSTDLGAAMEADAVVVPLVIAPPAASPPSWRRPLAWAAAILLIGAVAGGIAARDDSTEGVGTTDPAVPGTIGGNPEVRAAELALASLEAALATGEPATIAPAADTLRATLALLDPAERERLGDRPDELLAQANAALTVETTTSTTPTTTATSTAGADPGSTTTATTPRTIDDHGGGDDNSGPGSSGSGSSGSGLSGSDTSGSGSGRSGSDD